MTMYPWLKRHKRYLSFRYLFPQIAAAWITWRRGMLRLVWFFTHPIDEFLDDVRDFLLWPFAVLSWTGRWIVLAVVEFLRDLARGVEIALCWLGRLQVWTAAALAGVLGLILTILLFLLPAIDTPPAPAAIRSEPQLQTILSLSEAAHEKPPVPESSGETFDPFAGPVEESIAQLLPQPNSADVQFADLQQPDLEASVSRLSLPLGWNARRRLRADSVAVTPPRRERWMTRDQATLVDGWQRASADQEITKTEFTPYVAGIDARAARLTPSWISPEPTVDPLSRIVSSRQPSVVVEKMAPATARAGQMLQYSLLVSNLSDENLESVQVRERVSAIERVTRVEPAASVVGDELVWDVVDLNPGEQRRLTVELLPDQPVVLAHDTTVQVTAGVAAISEVRHPRPEPVFAEQAPDSAPPAQSPEPRIILPDSSASPADPPAQMSAEEPSRELFPWSFDSDDDLQADKAPLAGNAEEPEAAVEPPPTPPVPKPSPSPDEIRFSMNAPTRVVAGASVPTIFALHNSGEEDFTDVVLSVQLTEGLQHRHGGSLVLRIGRLSAGETYRTRLTTTAVRNGAARITSQIRCARGTQKSAEHELRIIAAGRPAEVVSGAIGGCPPPPCSAFPWF